jgi:hypothetical protein
MAYKRKKKSGRKCIRRKRVRVRGHGMQLRCAKYGPKRGSKTKRRHKRPFNKGRHCVQKYESGPRRGKCRSYGARPRAGRSLIHGPFMPSGAFFS